MHNLRIQTLASLVDKDAYVIDIGTDHAYLPIYLYKNNITKNITASDVSLKVLEQSKNNLLKEKLDKNIELIHSNGFEKINKLFDIAVIAGMGSHTIIDIISNAKKLPNTLIIQSNNNHDILREYMMNNDYKIDKEIIVNNHNIYYVLIKYIKGKEVLTKDELLFGKSFNKEYYTFLLNKYENIYTKNKNKYIENFIKRLKKIIEKIPD